MDSPEGRAAGPPGPVMGRDDSLAVRGVRARPGPAGTRPAGTRVRSGVDQDGQELSMLSRVSVVL